MRDHSPVDIGLIPATREQESIIANLLQLYAHDFSEFHDLELGLDGRFAYEHLPLYWRDADRHPFLIMLDGRLAGFTLVKRGSEISGHEAVWDMAEFFIVRGHRRRHLGTRIAHQVWKLFPGAWEVRVMQSNAMGLRFWEHAIADYVGETITSTHIEKDGEPWRLFSFTASSTT